MEPLTLFAIVTAAVLAAIVVVDWKGQPFLTAFFVNNSR